MIAQLKTLIQLAVFVVVGLSAQFVFACPTCKDTLTEQYVQAYGLSIVFMMSMPFLIFGSLACYFYFEVRKARARQAAEEAIAPASTVAQTQAN